jgi:flagellar motor switch protein FliM
MSKETMKVLRTIHEAFAVDFSIPLSSKLRTIARIDIRSVEQMPYEDYIKTVPTPGFLYIFRIDEIDRNGIFEIVPEMATALVDRMFGGQGTSSSAQTNSVTVIGHNMIRNLIQQGLSCMMKAWREALPLTLTLTAFEDTPEFAAAAPSTESMIVITFDITIQTQTYPFRICYPHFIMTKYFSERQTESAQDQMILEKGLSQTTVPLVVELGKVNLSIRDVTDLRVGDIVPLRTRPGMPLDILIREAKKFRGLPGAQYGRKVVKIVDAGASEEGEEM